MKKTFKCTVAVMLAMIIVLGGASLASIEGLTDWFGGLYVTASAEHMWQVGISGHRLLSTNVGDGFDAFNVTEQADTRRGVVRLLQRNVVSRHNNAVRLYKIH